jgi:hypothetical protein
VPDIQGLELARAVQYSLPMTATKRSKAYQAVLNDLAADWRNAPIVETNHLYRDTFQRLYETVSVELCHGEWRTFRKGSDGMPGTHASREAAKGAALKMLGL